MDYTTISQSKQLIEAGLEIDTADKYFNCGDSNDVRELKSCLFLKDVDIPCWSIEALSELLPPYLFEFERGIDLNIYRNLNGKGWHVSYLPNNTESLLKDKFRQISNGNTLIEAVYNMILWLLENNHTLINK